MSNVRNKDSLFEKIVQLLPWGVREQLDRSHVFYKAFSALCAAIDIEIAAIRYEIESLKDKTK